MPRNWIDADVCDSGRAFTVSHGQAGVRIRRAISQSMSLFLFLLVLSVSIAQAEDFDLAINNGRVIDPETGLDAVRHVGVRDGQIVEIADRPLEGDTVIDATGLVVSPGFIDRNSYTLGPELFGARSADGVTTTFNFEEGAYDVPAAYGAIEGEALINFGFSVSWGGARVAVVSESPHTVNNGIAEFEEIGPDETAKVAEHSLEDEELQQVLDHIEAGLKAGAPAVGMGVGYFSGATNREVQSVFNLAASYGRSVQIHARTWNAVTDHQDIFEPIAGAAISGGNIQISHLNSIAAEYIDFYLDYIERAQQNGVDVTAECYPYTAAMNDIRSEGYKDWQEWPDDRFDRYQWAETGEYLTRETFGKYREQGGFVIIHWMKEEWIDSCVEHPITQIASDGGWDGGKTHPRVAGSNTRVLGRYVREKGLLSLTEAIRKMALLPAQSLQASAPQMVKKGRLQVGMDADIVIFDPETVIDRATYSEPTLTPLGIEAVIVNGVVVRQSGSLIDGVFPGEAIRLQTIE